MGADIGYGPLGQDIVNVVIQFITQMWPAFALIAVARASVGFLVGLLGSAASSGSSVSLDGVYAQRTSLGGNEKLGFSRTKEDDRYDRMFRDILD